MLSYVIPYRLTLTDITTSRGDRGLEAPAVQVTATAGINQSSLHSRPTHEDPANEQQQNYAGDLLLPSTGLVVRTILSVFPSCRVFRELEREDNAVRAESRDFTNMVVFCTKRAEAPVVFREVVEEDLLGTVSRKMHLLPRHEVPLESFKTDAEGKEETSILATPEDVEKLAKYHLGSALGHWRVMRTVLPAKVWELW